MHLVYSHTSAINAQDGAVHFREPGATASIGTGTVATRADEAERTYRRGQQPQSQADFAQNPDLVNYGGPVDTG